MDKHHRDADRQAVLRRVQEEFFQTSRRIQVTEPDEPLPENLISHLPDADMQAVPRALHRAAKMAREIARRTKTPLVYRRDGVLVEEMVPESEDEPVTSNR